MEQRRATSVNTAAASTVSQFYPCLGDAQIFLPDVHTEAAIERVIGSSVPAVKKHVLDN
jgi:hypothetical protein